MRCHYYRIGPQSLMSLLLQDGSPLADAAAAEHDAADADAASASAGSGRRLPGRRGIGLDADPRRPGRQPFQKAAYQSTSEMGAGSNLPPISFALYAKSVQVQGYVPQDNLLTYLECLTASKLAPSTARSYLLAVRRPHSP